MLSVLSDSQPARHHQGKGRLWDTMPGHADQQVLTIFAERERVRSKKKQSGSSGKEGKKRDGERKEWRKWRSGEKQGWGEKGVEGVEKGKEWRETEAWGEGGGEEVEGVDKGVERKRERGQRGDRCGVNVKE